MIAASIPITMPALRWIGEKLSSSYRFVIVSLTAPSKKTETAEYDRSALPKERKRSPDTHSEEYILPTHAFGSGKDSIAVMSRDMECDKDQTIHQQRHNN